ncbi:MAG: hypothetical protein KF778_05520 [Rhodocyclaceae bacterium]|nr:hypothetical protein [Rhodocyclaceae bacterium]MBX3667842.1 hypothetical protein [Rhodocyclaceae bacterium]
MKFWFNSKSATPDLFEVSLGVECAWPTAVYGRSANCADDKPEQALAGLPPQAPVQPPARHGSAQRN